MQVQLELPVLANKSIIPLKPLMVLAVIMDVSGLTGFVVMLVGEADRLKSEAALTGKKARESATKVSRRE